MVLNLWISRHILSTLFCAVPSTSRFISNVPTVEWSGLRVVLPWGQLVMWGKFTPSPIRHILRCSGYRWRRTICAFCYLHLSPFAKNSPISSFYRAWGVRTFSWTARPYSPGPFCTRSDSASPVSA